jgi:hypothetical protein
MLKYFKKQVSKKMGSKTSGRPGGNPDLALLNKTDNPKTYKVTVAFDAATANYLEDLGRDRTDFIRAAVENAIKKLNKIL